MSIDNAIDSMIMDEHQAEHNAELRLNNEIEALEKWLDENESIHGDFLVYVDGKTLRQVTREKMISNCSQSDQPSAVRLNEVEDDSYIFITKKRLMMYIAHSSWGYTLETLGEFGGHTFSIEG